AHLDPPGAFALSRRRRGAGALSSSLLWRGSLTGVPRVNRSATAGVPRRHVGRSVPSVQAPARADGAAPSPSSPDADTRHTSHEGRTAPHPRRGRQRSEGHPEPPVPLGPCRLAQPLPPTRVRYGQLLLSFRPTSPARVVV